MSKLAHLRRIRSNVHRWRRRRRERQLGFLREMVLVSARLTRAEYNRVYRLADIIGVPIGLLVADCIRSGVVVEERAARDALEVPPESGPRVSRGFR